VQDIGCKPAAPKKFRGGASQTFERSSGLSRGFVRHLGSARIFDNLVGRESGFRAVTVTVRFRELQVETISSVIWVSIRSGRQARQAATV